MTIIRDWQKKYDWAIGYDPGVLLMPSVEITDDLLYGKSVVDMFREGRPWQDKIEDIVMLWHGHELGLRQWFSVKTPILMDMSKDRKRLFGYLTMVHARRLSTQAIMVSYEMSRWTNAAQYLPYIWFETEADAVNFSATFNPWDSA